jgi:hypothetical protein
LFGNTRTRSSFTGIECNGFTLARPADIREKTINTISQALSNIQELNRLFGHNAIASKERLQRVFALSFDDIT